MAKDNDLTESPENNTPVTNVVLCLFPSMDFLKIKPINKLLKTADFQRKQINFFFFWVNNRFVLVKVI